MSTRIVVVIDDVENVLYIDSSDLIEVVMVDKVPYTRQAVTVIENVRVDVYRPCLWAVARERNNREIKAELKAKLTAAKQERLAADNKVETLKTQLADLGELDADGV